MRLIDANALMDYCNNQKTKTIDANDIARFPTIGGWISVKDRLPPIYHTVLITGKNSVGGSFGVIKGVHDRDMGQWYRNDIGKDVDSLGYTVTHWMPLPEPPKEGEHEAD